MIRPTIGIVDYGIGNHSSVLRSFRDLGFRVLITNNTEDLNNTDLIVLPGVGAFPEAMQALHKANLVQYLQHRAGDGHPILGICLGMQLLASGSYEHTYTSGLNIVPGVIKQFQDARRHIGWNAVKFYADEPTFFPSNGGSFYFNHSLYFEGSDLYKIGVSNNDFEFPAAIRNGNALGVQFHPEKSQATGQLLLKNVVNGLVCD